MLGKFDYTFRVADKSLAAVARRFHTTVPQLRHLNPGLSPENVAAGTSLQIPTPPDEEVVKGCRWELVPVVQTSSLTGFLRKWAGGDGRKRLASGNTKPIRAKIWAFWGNATVRDRFLREHVDIFVASERQNDLDDPGEGMLEAGDKIFLPVVPVEHFICAMPETDSGTTPTATIDSCLPALSVLWERMDKINEQIDTLADARYRVQDVQRECKEQAVRVRKFSEFVTKRAWEYEQAFVVHGKAGRNNFAQKMAALSEATDYQLLNTDGAWTKLPRVTAATADTTAALATLMPLLRNADTVTLLDSCVPMLRQLADFETPVWSTPHEVAAGKTAPARALDLIFDLIATVARLVNDGGSVADVEEFIHPLTSILEHAAAPDPHSQNLVGYVTALAAVEVANHSRYAQSAAAFVGAAMAPHLAERIQHAIANREPDVLSRTVAKVKAAILRTIQPVLLKIRSNDLDPNSLDSVVDYAIKHKVFFEKEHGVLELVDNAKKGVTKWTGPARTVEQFTDEDLLRALAEYETQGRQEKEWAQEIRVIILDRTLSSLHDPKQQLQRTYAAIEEARGKLFGLIGLAIDLSSVRGSLTDLVEHPTAKGTFKAAKDMADTLKDTLSTAIKFKWAAQAASRPIFKVLGRASLILSVGSELVSIEGAFEEKDYAGAAGHGLVATGSVLICCGPSTGGVTIVIGAACLVVGYGTIYRVMIWEIVVPDMVLEYEKTVLPFKAKYGSLCPELHNAVSEVEAAYDASIWSQWKTDGNPPAYGAYDADPSKTPAAEMARQNDNSPAARLERANAAAGH